MKVINLSQNKNRESVKSSFIILGAGKPHNGFIHSSLCSTSGESRVLDWLIKAAEIINSEFVFVGGYQFDEIVRNYPDMKYVFNSDWEDSGSACSLLKALLNERGEHYISYADILFRSNVLSKIANVDADIVVTIDSQWRERYYGRAHKDLFRCEKVCFLEDIIISLGAGIDSNIANGEFIGLVKFAPQVVEFINRNNYKLSEQFHSENLSFLIEFLRTSGYVVKAVDISGDWAELNAPLDLTRFILGSKAQTLERLQGMIKRSEIGNQISFFTSEWQQDKALIKRKIIEAFGDQKLIVRSSSINEDSFISASAGVYKSVLNVAGGNSYALQKAIEEVISSYSETNQANQVLVQQMIGDILVSGVVFTRTIVHGAPYYMINYDDTTQNTTSITSGDSKNHKTIVILRDSGYNTEFSPLFISGLLDAVREIEQLLHYDALDIEFAIDRNGLIHIFQVRPIVYNEDTVKGADQEVYNSIEASTRHFRELQNPSPFIVGNLSFFGIMPDWNPAEIIGTKPGALAISLYRFLILDEVWAIQRAQYGYRDVRPSKLLVTFSGHPYIDIRASFNSFIPADLDDELAERLVNFYLNWLKLNPHLHDKVEFDVVPTCYSFNFKKWEERLTVNGDFSREEFNQLEESLRRITVSALARNKEFLPSISTLEKRYYQIISSGLSPLEQAITLLDDCKRYGTLAFAHLARSAFIGMALLKSAVEEGIITTKAMDSFLGSIHTVTHEFTEAASQVADDKLSWDDFIKNFGHLRPGTYEITSPCYSENPEYFMRSVKKSGFDKNELEGQLESWRNAQSGFARALVSIEPSLTTIEMELFIREAIEGREYAKFIFTRNLSAALNSFVEFGLQNGLSREELSNITLDKFISAQSGNYLIDSLKAEAVKGRIMQNLAKRIELPPLLFKEGDFTSFIYPENRANYIGSGKVTASCILMHGIEQDNQLCITGFIVLIQQADPGYDWIFGQDIAGLITMWGGANSHMAIRAAEFGIPAAIGIGELEFAKLQSALILELNAENHKIQIVR